MRRAALVAAAAVVATLNPACRAAPEAPLTVLAAASLGAAFTDGAVAGPGGRAAFSFAGSQQVVAQLEAGAPADVVATADPEMMDRLVDAGLVGTPRVFATNRLAIAVAPGDPGRVAGLADLGRPGLKVVLADPAVPAGRYSRQVLDRAGVRVRPVSLELDVKAVAAKVAAGEADAGLVYATDVAGPDRRDIAGADDVVARYSAAVVEGTRRAAAARDFVDRLLGTRAQAALAGLGFGPPPAGPPSR